MPAVRWLEDALLSRRTRSRSLGAQHPGLLLEAVDDLDKEVLRDKVDLADETEALADATCDGLDTLEEERDQLTVPERSFGQLYQWRLRGDRRCATVRRGTDRGQ